MDRLVPITALAVVTALMPARAVARDEPVKAPREVVAVVNRGGCGNCHVILGVPALQLLESHGYSPMLVGKGWAKALLAGHAWPVHAKPDALRARVASLRGDAPAAMALSRSALQSIDHPDLVQDRSLRAQVLDARGRSLCMSGAENEGEPALAEAVVVLSELQIESGVGLVDAQLGRVDCLVRLHRHAEARALLATTREALRGTRPAPPSLDIEIRRLQTLVIAGR